MSRGIADLIKENKKRFYSGEIRNYYKDEVVSDSREEEKSLQSEDLLSSNSPASVWTSLRLIGRKLGAEIFYEPLK
jgi:hypothetical protein